MPKKASSVYICQNCNYQSPKWLGQCPSCKAWNSLVETAVAPTPAGFRSKTGVQAVPAATLKLATVASKQFKRIATPFTELDRVLGGGIVPGSVTLVAGPPGIGKSSLLTSVVAKLKGLYVLGEESPQQVKLRVERMGLPVDFEVLPETNAETIVATIGKQPLVVVDSIQTLWTQKLTGVAGSVGQVRESAQMLLQQAKATDVPIIIVGHVTKEGSVAGPKVLEHLVDTVLQFEGDSKHEYRLLRAAKNRFGPTDEVGVFAMHDQGLIEVKNPSDLFLQDRQAGNPAGSVVVATMQGVRPVLVEIQALVNPTDLAMPRRVGTGIDQKRLQILCAVLSKHTGLKLSDKDVFVNVAGGLNLREPAADLGICLAIASSYKNKPVPQKTVAIGEVGLLGEIRQVSFMDKRSKEARAQGFAHIISAKEVAWIRQAVSKLQ
ncbi:DNA repair protein RadA [Candidatus Beckwithbacteria bacterium]|nr:DNA repair protein RadA [Candidatus Beckwithbacteria bacterium]